MIELTPNRQALLDTTAISELGRALIAASDDGYNVLFGSTAARPLLFTSYADHPRVRTYEKHDEFIRNGKVDFTTAAGRYMITASTFDKLKMRLGLTDFDHPAQDECALQLAKERGALSAIDAGDINAAIRLCAPVWASFPGGCGDQHENEIAFLRQAYLNAGGMIAGA